MVQVEEITLSHVNEQLIRGAKSCAVNTTISPQIPLLAASDNRWADTVEELQFKIESIVDRLSRRRKFEGQVYLVGDVLGGLVCYDMINHLYDNVSKQETNSLQTAGNPVFSKRSSMDHPSISRSHSLRSERSQTSQASHSSTGSFEYGIDFAGLLLFNCPLAYMILQRKYSGMKVPPIHVPIFNLFYPIDQNAARLEPIFMQDECPNEPILLCRRDLYTGCPRIDYMLSCPDGLATMSSKCLPQYLYAAFWESADAASLLLKQAIYVESTHAGHANDEDTLNPHKTSTRWQRRRTTLKVRNLEPNHRAQDCITTEGSSPVISGRFSYGFFDVAMLTGEKVELQIRSDISESGWETIDSQDTDSNGRVSFTLPPGRFKSVALYHFRLNVTGDNSSCFCSLAIVPRQSKCVVFSIDSSFAGSVSILGTDPKVRPASVDVARFWNDNDYLILYISSRPDMMKNRVVSWLKQHNFPNGFTFFQKGIHHDPYAKKCEMLKKIISSSELDVAAAYGGPKDLQIYRSINIPTRSIFVVGSKGKNKIQNMGTVLSEGYNVHLDWLRNSPFQNLPQSANSASRLILKRQTTCLH
ncbi:Oidioi.mRNA.OKI2018_I69.PAR.g11028.t2.cds [Oikopleura dioica]|uniref:Oidioi.mRNA.OKI2018_I69.PAR.g11028.t2.cds n=1 Tax=Oikopleura dioica TaxID=34765 RepID=A0ABN7RTK7_OIKDI|nr:Oidioi.mRNA.OKI2018_I69.PAR.g11028.t2.cds [Oikopleura dioica]